MHPELPSVYVVFENFSKHQGTFTTLAKAKAHVEEFVKFCVANGFLGGGTWTWEDAGTGEWLYGNGHGTPNVVVVTLEVLDRGMKDGEYVQL